MKTYTYKIQKIHYKVLLTLNIEKNNMLVNIPI